MTPLDPDVEAHYAQGVERERLTSWGLLEALRTRELLERFLPTAPAEILDIGGAEGAYALPLAASGYTVHLIDPWRPHVEAAQAASARAGDGERLASAAVGDARDLPFADDSADALLLLGPLYHLIDAADRHRALAEAHRVLRPGGVLFAAAISRFASTIDGLRTGAMADPAFARIAENDLRDGVHRNPDPEGHPEWFTLAYFHRPGELRDELATAGFTDIDLLAVEGPAAPAEDLLDDPASRTAVLDAVRRVEREPDVLGASNHLMAIGRAAGA